MRASFPGVHTVSSDPRRGGSFVGRAVQATPAVTVAAAPVFNQPAPAPAAPSPRTVTPMSGAPMPQLSPLAPSASSSAGAGTPVSGVPVPDLSPFAPSPSAVPTSASSSAAAGISVTDLSPLAQSPARSDLPNQEGSALYNLNERLDDQDARLDRLHNLVVNVGRAIIDQLHNQR